MPSIFLLQLFSIISFTLIIKDWFKAKNELNSTNPVFPSIYQAGFVLSSSMCASLVICFMVRIFVQSSWIYVCILFSISEKNLRTCTSKNSIFFLKEQVIIG